MSRAVETYIKCARGRLFVVKYTNGLLSLRSATAVTYLRTVARLGLVGRHVDAVKAGGSTCLTEACTEASVEASATAVHALV